MKPLQPLYNVTMNSVDASLACGQPWPDIIATLERALADVREAAETTEDGDEPFERCKSCGGGAVLAHVGRENWATCDTCKTRWRVGVGLVSWPFDEPPPQTFEEAGIAEYRSVEPGKTGENFTRVSTKPEPDIIDIGTARLRRDYNVEPVAYRAGPFEDDPLPF